MFALQLQCASLFTFLTLYTADTISTNSELFDTKFCGYKQTDSWLATSPWLVEIRAVDLEKRIYYTKCAGTILNKKYVLTTAKCLLEENGIKIFAVHVGAVYVDNITVGGLTPVALKDYYAIQEYTLHPLYDNSCSHNDIALLRLKREIVFDAFVQPICLPLSCHALKSESTLYRASVQEVIPLFRSLPRQKENIPSKLISTKKCNKEFRHNDIPKFITTYELCTEEFPNATKHQCDAFIGSPVMSVNNNQFFLEGILTKPPDCNRQIPGIYMKVSRYVRWIKENVKPLIDTCQTPTNETAFCIPLLSCPLLFNAFANPKKGTQKYWEQYICSSDEVGGILVCCPSTLDVDQIEDEIVPSAANRGKSKKRLSDKRFCGYQHRDDYLSNDTKIAIDEYPWLATIRAVDLYYGIEFSLCSGSLINSRYVLTSSFCLLQGNAKITSVLLGEYHIKNETDCVYEPTIGFQDCNEPVNYGIEEQIVHPFYNYWTYINDIALLKLNETVTYTEYIRPICLPYPEFSFVKPGDILYTTSFTAPKYWPEGPLKKKLTYELQSNINCTSSRPVTNYTMCIHGVATEVDDVFTCYDDDGAPAMFSRKNQWTLEGITTDRVARCNAQKPIKLTRVSMYLKWLEENIE